MLVQAMDRAALQELIAKWVDVQTLLDSNATDAELKAAVARIHPWMDAPAPARAPAPAPARAPAPAPAKPAPKRAPKPAAIGIGPQSLPSGRLPPEAAAAIHGLMGLTGDQVDVIMSLVSLPENGSSKWWDFYNYIEYGADSALRGYTTTIFGATSGTGSLLRVFNALAAIDPSHKLLKYHAALRAVKGGNIKGLEGLAHVGGDPTKAKANYGAWTSNARTHLDHIQGDLARLPNDDPAWRRAVWDAFIDLNWKSAADFCAKRGPVYAGRPGPVLTTPLAKGFMVDTSLNHGDARYWESADTWKVIFGRMKKSNATSEEAWLADFMQARRAVLASGYAGLDWSKTGDRCLLWLDLLRAKNHVLRRPITIANSTAKPHPIWPNNLTL
jgi:hypothetical protein